MAEAGSYGSYTSASQPFLQAWKSVSSRDAQAGFEEAPACQMKHRSSEEQQEYLKWERQKP